MTVPPLPGAGDAVRAVPRPPSLTARLRERMRAAAVGEDPADAGSLFQVMVRGALSQSHLMDLFSGMVRDPGGVLVDVGERQVRLRAHLTDPRWLGDTGGVVTERWHVAGGGADATRSAGVAHTVSGTFGATAAVNPSGRYDEGFSSATSVTRSDRTASFRITTEGEVPVPVHHFRAGIVVVAEVLPGRSALPAGLLPGRGTRSVAVQADQAVDYFVRPAALREDAELSRAGPADGDAADAAPRAEADRPLPASYAATGALGLAAVTRIAPADPGVRLSDVVTRTVHALAPGALVPGGTAYVPQAAKAVQELTAERGLAQAVAMRHVSVSFPHTGWLGPRLITLTISAEPGPGFDRVRARSAPAGSGVETQLLRATGEGSLLGPAAATARSAGIGRSGAVTAGLSFRDVAGLSAGDGNQHGVTQSRTHSTDRRVWLHPAGDSVLEADGVPYVVRVRAESRSLAGPLGLLPRLLLPSGIHDAAAALLRAGGAGLRAAAAPTASAEVAAVADMRSAAHGRTSRKPAGPLPPSRPRCSATTPAGPRRRPRAARPCPWARCCAPSGCRRAPSRCTTSTPCPRSRGPCGRWRPRSGSARRLRARLRRGRAHPDPGAPARGGLARAGPGQPGAPRRHLPRRLRGRRRTSAGPGVRPRHGGRLGLLRRRRGRHRARCLVRRDHHDRADGRRARRGRFHTRCVGRDPAAARADRRRHGAGPPVPAYRDHPDRGRRHGRHRLSGGGRGVHRPGSGG
ncbi:hypothetical protein SFUMM280S_01390 [Streptomyces fumanus]